MSKLFGLTAVVAAACFVLLVQPTKAADDPKSIKDIMKVAHSAPKGEMNLLQKATGKEATDADKKALLALYKDLGKSDPPQGEKDAWKKKSEEIVVVTQELVDGKDGAAAKVKKATDCKSCHTTFKPKT